MYLGSPKTSEAVGKMIEQSLHGTRFDSFDALQTAAISDPEAARLYDSIRRRVTAFHHEAATTQDSYREDVLRSGGSRA